MHDAHFFNFWKTFWCVTRVLPITWPVQFVCCRCYSKNFSRFQFQFQLTKHRCALLCTNWLCVVCLYFYWEREISTCCIATAWITCRAGHLTSHVINARGIGQPYKPYRAQPYVYVWRRGNLTCWWSSRDLTRPTRPSVRPSVTYVPHYFISTDRFAACPSVCLSVCSAIHLVHVSDADRTSPRSSGHVHAGDDAREEYVTVF